MSYEPVKCFWLEPTDEEFVFQRSDTGERITLAHAPPGAMWEATWLDSWKTLVDGKHIALVVRMPSGLDWMPAVGASNCTRKGEDHDCWCIHGKPPELTVDKNPVPGRSTCQAGAGSIQSGDWHGFLREGYLVETP